MLRQSAATQHNTNTAHVKGHDRKSSEGWHRSFTNFVSVLVEDLHGLRALPSRSDKVVVDELAAVDVISCNNTHRQVTAG